MTTEQLNTSTPTGPVSVPEPGQVVQVRGATWAVTDVREQGLSRSPADEARAGLEHLVALQSLAEDRMGEELTVVWELEVGTSIVPDRGLPETIDASSFDEPDTLGAFVDAVRWGAVTSADPKAFQAPFRSGVLPARTAAPSPGGPAHQSAARRRRQGGVGAPLRLRRPRGGRGPPRRTQYTLRS
ncbi:hypothetical protein [Propionibacterium ruminifibrarum]|uniref:hypothetical protein n=1 Tax=Propionibacterium ruminifibrarum TaxID=1962131 RepID=UPI001C7246E9|nr:hypothetical protein [Propionibacterium ruminifibrarum]